MIEIITVEMRACTRKLLRGTLIKSKREIGYREREREREEQPHVAKGRYSSGRNETR